MGAVRQYRAALAAAGVVLVVGAQAFQPKKTNPPIDSSRTIQARTAMSPEVNAILDRSCRDCHTNATTWPWYSSVAPVSWLVVSDVNDGRHHLNFSEWASYDARRVDKELDEMCEHVREGEMPLTSYTLLHPQAKLSEDDVKVVCAWTEHERGPAADETPATPMSH